jgi:hypothetical protein
MNSRQWIIVSFMCLTVLVLLSCGILEPARMAADYELALRTQAVLDITKTARTYPQLSGINDVQTGEVKMINAKGFVDPGWGASFSGMNFQITNNQAELAFPLEGGPAEGTVNFSFTYQQPQCPKSNMNYSMTLDGTYQPEEGFSGTVASIWTGYYYYFYETCKKYSDADYENQQQSNWQGTLVEDGDDLVIELEISDASDPENTWTIYLTAPAK